VILRSVHPKGLAGIPIIAVFLLFNSNDPIIISKTPVQLFFNINKVPGTKTPSAVPGTSPYGYVNP